MLKKLFVFLSILFLDLATKKWADVHLPLGKQKKITKKILYFQHIKNYGMAYHKLAGKNDLILKMTGGLTAIYSYHFLKTFDRNGKTHQYGIPLAITLAGAYGNFLERWKKGYVTDFIYIKKGKHAPIFNIADLALLFGAMFMGISSLKNYGKM